MMTNTKHVQAAITTIRAMPGPAEGRLRVGLRVEGNNEYLGHFAPDEAIKFVLENPRLELRASELWYLGS